VASGSGFETFLRDRIFNPLSMTETTFHPDSRQQKRLAKTYRKSNGGDLEETGITILLGGVKAPPPDSIPYPAGGLFSTGPDMARFYQMILSNGEKDGRRYVSRESLKMMTKVQTGELKTGFVDGMAWGFGWAVVREPKGVTAMLSPGSFGHGGAYGTQAWLDPARDRLFLLMIQRADLPNADASDIRRSFQEAAAQELK
jgi:CubicO group peptidase (beta-lactamase class C family)